MGASQRRMVAFLPGLYRPLYSRTTAHVEAGHSYIDVGILWL